MIFIHFNKTCDTGRHIYAFHLTTIIHLIIELIEMFLRPETDMI